MTLSFELTMPGRNTWNGRWSGEGQIYAIVKNLGKSQKAERNGKSIVEGGPYGYNWDDGWRARVTVREVDVKEARRVRRQSKGFCGYDWMVDSIINYGNIQTAKERKERDEKDTKMEGNATPEEAREPADQKADEA